MDRIRNLGELRATYVTPAMLVDFEEVGNRDSRQNGYDGHNNKKLDQGKSFFLHIHFHLLSMRKIMSLECQYNQVGI